ncbi:MAG: PIN domain-containing protein [Saprospiraceae bacterium]|nr:PIN domain-containing protein [Saprospiraceae bacterium]
MPIVIDTNLFFVLLRAKNDRLREVYFDSRYQFYAPNFLIAEIFNHAERVLKSSKSDTSKTYEVLSKMLEYIVFVNENFISTENYIAAYRFCKTVDENDAPFVALSLELDAPFWTKDEKLKVGLQKKGFYNFFNPFDQ